MSGDEGMSGMGGDERMSGDDGRIRALGDLPQQIAPPRDLWAGIEARLMSETRAATSVSHVAGVGKSAEPVVVRRRAGWSFGRAQALAAAAVIAALAIGVWIGRAGLPFGPRPAATPSVAGLYSQDASTVRAAYLMDSRYALHRQELVQSLDAKIASLPPESRAKVVSSLKTLHDSLRDLEQALGHDPSNALLQELLVNTYQDEMRVLTAVNEAGSTSEGT